MNEPVWFRRTEERSERFAAAVDGSARGREDAEFADELALVSMLRELGPEPVVDGDARERMRTAILTKVAQPAEAPASTERAVPIPARRLATRQGRQKRRASALAAATAAGIVAFGALGIEMAGSALPGDFLYDIKRTTEALSLDLTFSEASKARKQLEIAATRIDELAALVERDAHDGGTTTEEAALYRVVLGDLDKAAADGSRRVTSYSTQSDGSDLRMLRDWAAGQSAKMSRLRTGIADSLVYRFDASVGLLRQIEQRASGLLDRLRCTEITLGVHDRIGAVPADSACVAADTQQRVRIEPKASSRPATSAGKDGEVAGPRPTGSAPSSAGPAATEAPMATPQPPIEGTPDTDDPSIGVPPLPQPSAPTLGDDLDRDRETANPVFPPLP